MEQVGIFYSGTDSGFCAGYSIFVVFSLFLTNESVHVLVLLRSWALWGCKRSVFITLLFIYLAYAVWAVVTPIVETPAAAWAISLYYGTIRNCVGYMPEKSYIFWIGSLLIDTIFFLCMMYSLRIHERLSPYPTRLRRHLRLSANLYYGTCVITGVLTALAWKYWGPYEHFDPRSFLTTTICGPLLSIVGQRLVLSLRSLQGQNLGVSTSDLSREVRRQLAEFESDDDRREWEEELDIPHGNVRNDGLEGGIELASRHQSQG